MTREQIIETYMINSKKVIAEMLYDTIQRYESRTCENCKYSVWHDGLLCERQVCSGVMGGIDNHPYVESDFGCNKWGAKDD